MKILFCGAGALGSHTIAALRFLTGNEYSVVDFDDVEKKNLWSQWYTRQVVGKNKASAIQLQMMSWYGIKVQSLPHRLSENNIDKIFDGQDLIVDTFDNIESRQLVLGHVNRLSIPCVHGALSADGMFGCVRWSDTFVPDAENVPGQATCEAGEFLPLIMNVSSRLAFAIQRFSEHGEKLSFNIVPFGS